MGGIVFDKKDEPIKGIIIQPSSGAPSSIGSIDIIARGSPTHKEHLNNIAYEYNKRYPAWVFWVVPTIYGDFYLVSEKRL